LVLVTFYMFEGFSFFSSKKVQIFVWITHNFTSILMDKNLCLILWNGFWLVWLHFICLKVFPSFLPKSSNFCVDYPQFHLNLWWTKLVFDFMKRVLVGLVHFIPLIPFNSKAKLYSKSGDTRR
jgi:hypothetical protein